MSDPVFCIDWYSGATAQVEIFSPRSSAQDVYELKYTPGFRATIRPPVEGRPLGPGELDPINQQLNDLVVTLKARAGAPGNAPPAASSSREPVAQMEMLGSQLLDLILPQYVQADLRTGDFAVEIGMDEALLEYPWELLHDGNDFLCLRHAVGRFVNGTPAPMAAQQPVTRVGLGLDELSVLLISVPRPLKRGEIDYDYLPEAEAETDAILQALSNLHGVKVSTVIGKKATFTEVYNALKQGGHHIVHFNGHAHFDEAKPRLSGLVLFDRDMTTGPVVNYFGKNPPILCFVNACETAKTGEWRDNYNIFGLARAFLDTGAYLLGSRWKINDQAAGQFASDFYLAFLRDGKSLGEAVRCARVACRKAGHDEFAWASYVLYGDPRMCFRRLNAQAGEGGLGGERSLGLRVSSKGLSNHLVSHLGSITQIREVS